MGNAYRVKFVKAFKATESDIQTLIATIGRKNEGWRQAFFCDSGADNCLVNEAKATHDKIRIVKEGTTKLVGTAAFCVGLNKESPDKPLKVFGRKEGNYDKILLSTLVMKNGVYFQ